jgi:hypothetical protein
LSWVLCDYENPFAESFAKVAGTSIISSPRRGAGRHRRQLISVLPVDTLEIAEQVNESLAQHWLRSR